MCKHFPFVSVARFVCECLGKSVAVACDYRPSFLFRAPLTLRDTYEEAKKH